MSARISLSGIAAHIGGRLVLDGVTASFGAGEMVALIGPNGAGKSSLLRVMTGLLAARDGQVLLAGEGLETLSHRQCAAHLAYLPQARPVAWNILTEDLAALGRFSTGAGPYARCGAADREAIDTALEKAGAAAFRGRSVHALSGGEQARVHLARVLASPAQVLLLDEPLAALDIRHQLDLMTLLRAECAGGRTVIAALHDLSLAARMCDRLIVMKGGHVVADATPVEALSDSVLSDVFGVTRSEDGFVSAR